MTSTSEPIGRVIALHRYPVKSMAGETLESADITAAGVLGDRAYALIDTQTGHAVSGKRPKKWPAVLDYRGAFEQPPREDETLPPVEITLPDGSSVSSTDRIGLNARLSDALGTSVTIESVVPDGVSFEYHWPDMEGLVFEGREYRDEITAHEMPAGTFFDSSTLLLLTTTSLAHLRELVPDSDFDVRRFRPNIVIEPLERATGFAENAWVGGTLEVGEVRIGITKPCLRCVMVTSPQADLPKDSRVLRAVFDHNEGNVGVKGAVIASGAIRVGDEVRIVEAQPPG